MRRTICLAVVVVALVSACSGSQDEAGDTSDGGANQPSASGDGGTDNGPDQQSDAVCLSVSLAKAKAIARGAQDGTGFKPLAAAAYRSPDFSKVYFIAVRFSATGVSDQQGVWVSNGLGPGGGLILSADAIAKNFTDWRDASTTDAKISGADPGIEKALDCL
jgi:hypothetical protein